jgi:hypothetical protein
MLAELWCAVLVTMQDRSCDFRWTPVQRYLRRELNLGEQSTVELEEDLLSTVLTAVPYTARRRVAGLPHSP